MTSPILVYGRQDTMTGKRFAAALLAAGLLAWAAPAQAGDTLRLGMPGGAKAKTLTLKATPEDLEADTVAVARGGFARGGVARGGFHGGFHHGGSHHAGSHHGFHHGSFHHGSHHFHHGFHSGFRGFHGGWGRGWGWGGGYYPGSFYGLGLGYPYSSYAYSSYPYYSYPLYGYPYSYGSPYGGYPLGTSELSTGPAAYGPSTYPDEYGGPADDPPMPPAGGESTYPYDGGPREPIPLPKEESGTPSANPRKGTPPKERVISFPVPEGKWVYPAYGEAPRRAAPKEYRDVLSLLVEAAR
jgi:hypothetical protein